MAEHYVLGTRSEELDRLGLQHQIWQSCTSALWEQAHFGPGQTLLDAGCGPGFSTADLAALVGTQGRVVAVDGALEFAQATRLRCEALGYAQVEARHADLNDAPFDDAQFDGIFLRWVVSFLAEPAPLVQRLATSLKPGGRLLAMDYGNYRAAKLFPECAVLIELFDYFERANRTSGGDFDHGVRLAQWALDAGLRVTHFEPIVHAARPGDRYWRWFTGFCRVFVPSLVASGQMPAAFAEQVVGELRQLEQTPGAFFMTPPVMAMIAIKD